MPKKFIRRYGLWAALLLSIGVLSFELQPWVAVEFLSDSKETCDCKCKCN
jgi:hypothetical protein